MRIQNVDLNLLVSLDALLSERNVTRAAERLSLGQPAVSASLARLRRHFGDPLLVRDKRQLVLTPFGESLIEPVKEALRAATAALSGPSTFDPVSETRTFTLIASDYVTLVLLRPLLKLLAEQAPSIRLAIEQIDDDYVDQLRRGRADAVILPAQMVGKGFPFAGEQLFTDRYELLLDQGNSLVGDEVTLDELLSLNFVSYSAGTLPAVLDAQLESRGIRLRTEVATHDFIVAPFLVAGTKLATFVPHRLAAEFATQFGARIVGHPIDLQLVRQTLYWHPRNTEDPAHRWLREMIKEVADKLPDYP